MDLVKTFKVGGGYINKTNHPSRVIQWRNL